MGGSITIAARFNDGTTICIEGWTNFLPKMIMNNKTLSGDDSIVREILFKASRIESYIGPVPFRAIDYGIVVIDFKSKQIHSMQEYTNFDKKYVDEFIELSKPKCLTGNTIELSKENKSLIDAGRVKIISINGVACTPKVLTPTAAIKIFEKKKMLFMSGKGPIITETSIDLTPFQLFSYPESTSLTKMKKRLSTVGFPMTKKNGLNSIFNQHKST